MASAEDPLAQYKTQLSSVEESLKSCTDENRADLLYLKEKLTEVIVLLQGDQVQENPESNDQKPFVNQEKGATDDEFLRFQREIGQLGDEEPCEATEEDVAVHKEFCSVLSSMEGKKCRAPFMREWGEKAYHNAIIFATDIEDGNDPESVMVKVMFCNPTCDKMKPCPFFLDGHCKFDDDQCRYSHGYGVNFGDLEEYILPDYGNVQRDSRCLAKYKDGLWYSAIVDSCLKNQKYSIMYTNSKDTDTLQAQDILPLGDVFSLSDDDSSDDNSSDDMAPPQEISEAASLPPIQREINYVTVDATSPIGCWEQHTKGIGSKLMAKMGYVWGQGLGKNSNGRLDPVEAIVLPRGKSLDKCAEIRERAGLDSVEDRFSSEQVKEKQRVKNIEKNQTPESSVFAFLNKNISKSNGECSSKSSYLSSKRSSSDRPDGSSNKSQGTDLNFEMYSVGEAIKKTRKELCRLQQSVKRNAERNEAACSHMKQKMAVQNNLLRTLEAKEKRISDEINKKKNHRKIAIF